MAATLDGRVEVIGAVFEAKFMLPWNFSEEAAAEKHMVPWLRMSATKVVNVSVDEGGGKPDQTAGWKTASLMPSPRAFNELTGQCVTGRWTSFMTSLPTDGACASSTSSTT
jgi:hypothetical protein